MNDEPTDDAGWFAVGRIHGRVTGREFGLIRSMIEPARAGWDGILKHQLHSL